MEFTVWDVKENCVESFPPSYFGGVMNAVGNSKKQESAVISNEERQPKRKRGLQTASV